MASGQAANVQSATTRPSLSWTIDKIRKNNPSNPKKMQEALVLIRKFFIKEKTGTDRLRHYGGIEALFDVIRGTNQTCSDIALSIVGNISMDTKVQNKILHIDGIKTLGKVIEEVENADIANRACRTLGNLAQNPVVCCAIHEEERIVADLVFHLNKAEDVALQLTLIRTLRLFADSSTHRLSVLNEEGLRAVSLHMKSEDERVIKAAYQCVLVLSKEFTDACARQIVAADAPATVLEHTAHELTVIKRAAFNLLMNTWMNHHEMRVGIGNAGGIPFFINHINTLTEQRKRLIMANSLCLSCCEVVNRVRVKDNGGLQIFLKMLQEPEYALLHDRLISALTCFLYDESGWEILMKNGLVSVLIKHLKRVAKLDELVKKHEGQETRISIEPEQEVPLSSDVEQKEGVSLNSKLEQDQEKEVASTSISQQVVITKGRASQNAAKDKVNQDDTNKETVQSSTVKRNQQREEAPSGELVKDEAETLESSSKTKQSTPGETEVGKKAAIQSVQLSGGELSKQSLDSSLPKVVKGQLKINIIKESTHGEKQHTSEKLSTARMPEIDTVRKAQKTSMQTRTGPVTKAVSEAATDSKCDQVESETKPKSNVTRYSVDSPTYKSVVDWTPDDYMSGPRNILESEHYQSGSPDRLSGYSSPSNYGLYSPLSISSFDLSPDTSPRPRSVSPNLSLAEKKLYSSPEPSAAHRSSPPIWSPTHSTFDEAGSSQFSVPSLPGALAGSVSPLVLAGNCQDVFIDEALQYSSSDEDDDNKNFTEVLSDGDECSVFKKDQSMLESQFTLETISPSTSLASEAVDAKSGDNTTKASDPHQLNSDVSDTDGGGPLVRGKRTPLSSKSGTKRKRDVTPEMRKRILLSVEQSQSVPSASIDLTKMMAASNVFNKKRELGLQSELPSDKRDHRRQIEYCLIMLIKKISCYADPTDDLINTEVIGTLMDYVSLAAKTFSKCGRILVRLTKNTACFEAIILKMIPQLINERLITKLPKVCRMKDCGSKAKNTTKPPEVINRSMSSCTLSEATKATQFHDDVKRQQKKTAASRARGVNYSEAAQLKATLFSNLAFMAETPFGQGVIEHLLLTASSRDRMRTAVALSLICRSRSLQTKMYIEHRGFRYLIMAIEQKEDRALQHHTVCGLLTMASLRSNKQFSVPAKCRASTSNRPPQPEDVDLTRAADDEDNSDDLHDVIFKMGDGSTVSASRAVLTQHSEVFSAMLGGHYAESGKSEISMPGVSSEAFHVVIDHLHGKLLKDTHTSDVVLEAHGLADRFILDDLMRALCDLIVERHLHSMDNLCKIFAHAVLHEAYWMMRKCMSFLLLDPAVSDAERLSRFQTVLKSPQGDVAVDVIEDMFHS